MKLPKELILGKHNSHELVSAEVAILKKSMEEQGIKPFTSENKKVFKTFCQSPVNDQVKYVIKMSTQNVL